MHSIHNCVSRFLIKYRKLTEYKDATALAESCRWDLDYRHGFRLSSSPNLPQLKAIPISFQSGPRCLQRSVQLVCSNMSSLHHLRSGQQAIQTGCNHAPESPLLVDEVEVGSPISVPILIKCSRSVYRALYVPHHTYEEQPTGLLQHQQVSCDLNTLRGLDQALHVRRYPLGACSSGSFSWGIIVPPAVWWQGRYLYERRSHTNLDSSAPVAHTNLSPIQILVSAFLAHTNPSPIQILVGAFLAHTNFRLQYPANPLLIQISVAHPNPSPDFFFFLLLLLTPSPFKSKYVYFIHSPIYRESKNIFHIHLSICSPILSSPIYMLYTPRIYD